MGSTGLEQSVLKPLKTVISKDAGTESGTVNDNNAQKNLELQKIISAWPSLSEHVQKQILSLIEEGKNNHKS